MMLCAWKWVEFSGGGCPEGKVVRYNSTSPWEYPHFLFDTKILLGRQPAIRKIRNRETFSTRGLRLVGSRDSGRLWEFLPIPGAQCDVTMCFSLSLSFSSLLQVFTKYGKCYMFNSGEDGKPLLTTVKGGTGNGLEIMLDIQQDEYLPIWGETGELGPETLAPGGGEGCRLPSERLV